MYKKDGHECCLRRTVAQLLHTKECISVSSMSSKQSSFHSIEFLHYLDMKYALQRQNNNTTSKVCFSLLLFCTPIKQKNNSWKIKCLLLITCDTFLTFTRLKFLLTYRLCIKATDKNLIPKGHSKPMGIFCSHRECRKQKTNKGLCCRHYMYLYTLCVFPLKCASS